MLKIPDKVPEPGFYYHYKHDPNGALSNYAYEVLGVGHHTENDSRPEDANMVVYRPLYESSLVYQAGKMFDLRPIDLFLEDVTKDGKIIARFQKITDPKIIGELEKIKKEMYGTE